MTAVARGLDGGDDDDDNTKTVDDEKVSCKEGASSGLRVEDQAGGDAEAVPSQEHPTGTKPVAIPPTLNVARIADEDLFAMDCYELWEEWKEIVRRGSYRGLLTPLSWQDNYFTEFYSHREGDIVELWKVVLLSWIGMVSPVLPDGTARMRGYAGMSQMLGSGKTSLANEALWALRHPPVRRALQAWVIGQCDECLSVAWCRLLACIDGGEAGDGALNNDPLMKLSVGKMVYFHVHCKWSSSLEKFVSFLISTFFPLSKAAGLPMLTHDTAHSLSQTVNHIVRAFASRGWSMFLVFDAVDTLDAQTITELFAALADATVAAQDTIQVFCLFTGRVLPTPVPKAAPSTYYLQCVLSFIPKDVIAPLMCQLFQFNGITVETLESRLVQFRHNTTNAVLATEFNLDQFVDSVHRSTCGAPRLVMMCMHSLAFRLRERRDMSIVRDEVKVVGGAVLPEASVLTLRLNPERIVEYVYEMLARSSPTDLFAIDEQSCDSEKDRLCTSLRTALLYAALRVPIHDATVLVEAEGGKPPIYYWQLKRAFYMFDARCDGGAVHGVAPEFAVRFIESKGLISASVGKFITSCYEDRRVDVTHVFKLACSATIHNHVVQYPHGYKVPCEVLLPVLRGSTLGAEIVLTEPCLHGFMPTISDAVPVHAKFNKNSLSRVISHIHPINIPHFLSDGYVNYTRYFVAKSSSDEHADAFFVTKVEQYDWPKQRVLMEVKCVAGTEVATVGMVAEEAGTSIPPSADFKHCTTLLLYQAGMGPELASIAGDMPLMLTSGKWDLVTVSVCDLSVHGLYSRDAGKLICDGHSLIVRELPRTRSGMARTPTEVVFLDSTDGSNWVVDFAVPSAIREVLLNAGKSSQSRVGTLIRCNTPPIVVKRDCELVIPGCHQIQSFLGTELWNELSVFAKATCGDILTLSTLRRYPTLMQILLSDPNPIQNARIAEVGSSRAGKSNSSATHSKVAFGSDHEAEWLVFRAAFPYLSIPVTRDWMNWSNVEVAVWLAKVCNVTVETVYALFSNGVRGASLPSISFKDMMSLGVWAGDAQTIVNCVRRLPVQE